MMQDEPQTQSERAARIEARRFACEAAGILKMPKHARRAHLARIEAARGLAARQALEEEIWRQWKAAKAMHEDQP